MLQELQRTNLWEDFINTELVLVDLQDLDLHLHHQMGGSASPFATGALSTATGLAGIFGKLYG